MTTVSCEAEFFNCYIAVKEKPECMYPMNIFTRGCFPLKIGIINLNVGYFFISIDRLFLRELAKTH